MFSPVHRVCLFLTSAIEYAHLVLGYTAEHEEEPGEHDARDLDRYVDRGCDPAGIKEAIRDVLVLREGGQVVAAGKKENRRHGQSVV